MTDPRLAFKQECIDPYIKAGIALGNAALAYGKTAQWIATHTPSESATKAAAKISELYNKAATLAHYAGDHPAETLTETAAILTEICLNRSTAKLSRLLDKVSFC